MTAQVSTSFATDGEWPRTRLWRVAFAALVFGCLSAESATPSSGLSAEAYCKALARQECAAFAGCCSLTTDDCQTKGTASCLGAVDALSTYGMKFDGASAQECLDATRLLYSDCGYVAGDVPQYLKQAAACRAITAGTIPLGGACQYDDSCVSGSDQVSKCQLSKGQRICIQKPLLKPGDNCQTGEGECGADAFCDVTCKPLKASGELCDDNADCASSLCTDTCFVPDQAYVCKKITG